MLVSCSPNQYNAANDLLPAYCFWEGVRCCTSYSTFNCDLYSVPQLQLRAANIIGGTLDSIWPQLQDLHTYGLIHLDLSRNQITGTLPQSLGQLNNLQILLLGSNSEWLGVQYM